MTRGYSILAADRPKDLNNFAGLMHAGHCYGAKMLVLAGDRYRHMAPNTTKAERTIPFLRVTDVAHKARLFVQSQLAAPSLNADLLESFVRQIKHTQDALSNLSEKTQQALPLDDEIPF